MATNQNVYHAKEIKISRNTEPIYVGKGYEGILLCFYSCNKYTYTADTNCDHAHPFNPLLKGWSRCLRVGLISSWAWFSQV